MPATVTGLCVSSDTAPSDADTWKNDGQDLMSNKDSKLVAGPSDGWCAFTFHTLILVLLNPRILKLPFCPTRQLWIYLPVLLLYRLPYSP